MAKEFKLPKTLGACADLLFTTRQKRLELQKLVDACSEQEKSLKEHIINTLPKSEATGIAGTLCRVTVVVKTVPSVKNWDDLYAYIKRTSSFELLQRRVVESAVVERWENNKEIPGVERFNAAVVSISKL